MFIRTKKINNKQYAYLVQNVWSETGNRQKVAAYLGKIHMPAKQETKATLATQTALIANTQEEIINELIENELKQHQFKEHPDNPTLFIHDMLIYNKKTNALKEKNKDVVLKINDGYLCNYTIQQIREECKVQKQRTDPHVRAVKLAETLVTAGLKVPQETFIKLHQAIEEAA